ncbi:hypothetical protein [Sutterella sp.]|uniref:hypothetical protein n=1 Tax=Sutterella sp. TaxID=1981025 RepID=UPI0026DF2933|nr:hypothetical protein [Sutterella sp.]MDO5530527.1 hypothetical protein [Sutterella sp.]
MTTAYTLIPGARLPARAAPDVLACLSPAVRERLGALGLGCEAPGLQRLSAPLHEYSPHRAWLWKVLTGRSGAPVIAPYAWIAAGGPRLDQCFWSLDPWRVDDEGRLARITVPDEKLPAFASAMDAGLHAHGLRLMISGDRFFATRREAFDLEARPFEDLVGMAQEHIPHLPHLARGADAPAAIALAEELTEAVKPHVAGLEGFWLSGGGRVEPVFPPSPFRAVVTDDAVVRAWADNAGIPRSAIAPMTVRGEPRAEWPAAPEGDRIAVFADLYEAWLREDWDAWLAALPELLDRIDRWKSTFRGVHIDTHVMVFFGHAGAATLLPAKKSPLAFWKKAPGQPLESWLIESAEEE